MARFTVASIESKISEKYENVEIADDNDENVVLFTLRAPLRLTSAERKQLSDLQEENEARVAENKAAEEEAKEAGEEFVEPEFDAADYYRKFMKIVADRKQACAQWLEERGDDVGFLAEVVSVYSEAVSVGEASPSES